jgi:hypothetical protein
MTYTLITANRNYSSWSLRPWLLMKARGIPFAERFEPFTKPDNYEDFRKFSPTGQVPVLLHDGRTIADSWRSLSTWQTAMTGSGLLMKRRGSLPRAPSAKCMAGLAICATIAP